MSLAVGVAGLGTIGAEVARRLDAGVPGLTLTAVSSGREDVALERIAALSAPVPVVDAKTLAARCDVIVECAPTAAFVEIVEPALAAGRTVVTVSAAAILRHPDIVERAARDGGRIILATGALLGLDAVRAAAEGEIRSVRMITRKPPKSLATAKYVVEHGLDLTALSEPVRLFAGNARDGALAFPANVNVAAALGLAGIGPERTELEIWADPARTRNCHRIEVESDSARFTLEIENIPTEENPGTGRITALSIVSTLRGLVAPFRAGS